MSTPPYIPKVKKGEETCYHCKHACAVMSGLGITYIDTLGDNLYFCIKKDKIVRSSAQICHDFELGKGYTNEEEAAEEKEP